MSVLSIRKIINFVGALAKNGALGFAEESDCGFCKNYRTTHLYNPTKSHMYPIYKA